MLLAIEADCPRSISISIVDCRARSWKSSKMWLQTQSLVRDCANFYLYFAAHRAEKASIDEAFIDLTPMVLDKLRSDHAQVWSEFGSSANDQSLPPAPLIESENWSGWQAVHTADDETVEDKPSTWQDWALLYGAEIMLQMRTAVQDRLGFTCSAVSQFPGRVLDAKLLGHHPQQSHVQGRFRLDSSFLSCLNFQLCSAWKKPAAQTVLRESDVLTCLKTLPIKKVSAVVSVSHSRDLTTRFGRWVAKPGLNLRRNTR